MTAPSQSIHVAFAEGMEAREADQPVASCPYPPGTDEHTHWVDGWHEPDNPRSLALLSPHGSQTTIPLPPRYLAHHQDLSRFSSEHRFGQEVIFSQVARRSTGGWSEFFLRISLFKPRKYSRNAQFAGFFGPSKLRLQSHLGTRCVPGYCAGYVKEVSHRRHPAIH